jgi:hypothetical protein
MGEALLQSAVEKLDLAIKERVKRLGDVAAGMPLSIEIYKRISGERVSEKTIRNKQEFFDRWKSIEKIFQKSLDEPGDSSKRDGFLRIIEKSLKQEKKDYLSTIKGLTEKERDLGTSWLQGLVDDIYRQVGALVPGFGI